MRAVVIALACAGTLAACGSSDQEGDTRPWKMIWNDEFDGASLDTSKWSVETGNSFGTGQKDFDTERAENIAFQNGNLMITARAEKYSGADYTSGRIRSYGKFSRAYGRYEARMRLPRGQGMWPAFWLLGDNWSTAGWPQCGEIDVMENKGAELSTVHGTMHGPGYSDGATYTKAFTLPNGASFTDDFHTFAIEWEPGQLRWYVDDALYQTRSSDTMPRSQTWVFDQPFFIIVDLAVGGVYGGDPDATTSFPQSLMVDYVRVYSRGGDP